jgi:S-adenosylmethionine synthetase
VAKPRPFVFTSESVTEGHPDKLADRVSDSIVDFLLSKDKEARVAAECLVADQFLCIAGEVKAAGFPTERDEAGAILEPVARKAVKDVGYHDAKNGMGWDSARFLSRISPQSLEIGKGVEARRNKRLGAGDQGLMFGYAEADDDFARDMMPVPIHLAHALTRRLAELRRSGKLRYLGPDGKSQVSVRFEGDEAVGLDTIVLAAQHDADMEDRQAELKRDLVEHCIREVVPEAWLGPKTNIIVNGTGSFVKGGPASDAGLTGRKIIVDSYGGWVPHGGGAFSGKDATKVDRSGAYYARFAAKSLVAAGLARKVQIQVAYSIGNPEPVALDARTFGTGDDAKVLRALKQDFDFSPGHILDELKLRRPLYTPTSSYGHFGRSDVDVPWERVKRL